MEMIELMRARHSVRRYLAIPVEKESRNTIDNFVNEQKVKSELNIQVFYDEPKAFQSFLAHYGSFRNVINYVAFVGQKEEESKVGYYGQAIVLKLQELGLNSCWVAVTYSKRKSLVQTKKGESILSVIAFGYGQTQGVTSRSKSPNEVLQLIGEKPKWLDLGIEAALLAPTAVNQQKFKIICENGAVSVKKEGHGYYMDIDLGIVKYHFETITGQKVKIIE
ncbi:MAG: nitroreductase family protein [Desulfobacterales bacterium]|jgi:nitroreductase|nr:nitroreductase family protein [Desulfobacterales bacterium]